MTMGLILSGDLVAGVVEAWRPVKQRRAPVP
jgi:hypothetical protein